MQPGPDQYTSISRRSLDIEDYIDILRRHKASILGPTFAGLVVAVVVAFLWPDTYVSSAVIRIVPPQIPESFVPANINQEMSQRINAMYQTISSRTQLTNIINLLNLYPNERKRKPMEDIIEEMRSSIKMSSVTPLTAQAQQRPVSAFSISFSYSDRITAQKVTADLVSRFMSENARQREQESRMTTQFLKDQLDEAKKELDSVEDKLAKFRMSAQGRLPDQVQQNNFQMNALEQRIANINSAISRVQQEKMLAEADLRSVKNQLNLMSPASEQMMAQQKNEELVRVDREIQSLEAAISTLKEHYTDNYPEVKTRKSQLNSLTKLREKILTEDAEKKAGTTAPVRRLDPTYEREKRGAEVIADRLEAQIRSKDAQLQDYQKELAVAERQVRTVQSRIEQMPLSEQQYLEVVRDRELSKKKYDEMNMMHSKSTVSQALEQRHQGESLDVLDPASLPLEPVQPKRPYWVGVGVGFGFVLGICLAGAREAKDTSLKNLKDVRAYTQLSIIGSIPLLENDLVVRRRKRLTWLAWSTACLVGVMIMTGAILYYSATKI